MSKSVAKNKILVIALTAAFVLSAFLFITAIGFKSANAEVGATVDGEIKSEYAFGDELDIPGCVFEKNGKEVKGTYSLQFPDGEESFEKKVTLGQSGIYVLRYIAAIDGAVCTKELKFSVSGKLATYKNDKTSVSYGLCTDLGANSEGLMLKIANGDEVTFNHVFDMTKLDMSAKLLEGFVVPSVRGAADFTQMVFTFTDIEDSSVYLTYHGNFHNDSNSYGLTYFTTAGNGQTQCGLEYAGRLHVGTEMGCPVPHSFVAKDTGLYWGAQEPKDVAPDYRKFFIGYDSARNQTWAGGKLISDLDDGNYYTSLWLGFPSGKARLTVSAKNYNSATANICLTSVLGIDLSAETFVDEDAPVITVDNDYETMPDAVVGKSYPVSSATAKDEADGEVDVKISVWYDYASQNKKSVNIENGRFKVDNVGTYAIVYEATDHSGNVGKKVLWVRAKLSKYVSKLTVSLQEDYPTDFEVGQVYDLPQATVEGGSGNTDVAFEIAKGNVTADVEDGKFRLEESGEWTLTCTATDYVGNVAVQILKINATASGKPIIESEPELPCAYVALATYRLPVLYAYDYSSGSRQEKLCSVKVECGIGSNVYTAGDEFVPSGTNEDGKVKITYFSDDTDLYIKEVPVYAAISTEKVAGSSDRYRDVVNVEKYFYTDSDLTFTNNVKSGEISGMTITVNADGDKVKTTFINPQMVSVFSLDFLTVPGKSDFSKIAVRLTDSENTGLSVTAYFVKSDGATILTVGTTSVTLDLDLDSFSPASFGIGYKNGKFTVSGSSFAIDKTDNGEDFEGFPSDKIYFDIEIYDAKEGAEIFLQRVCGVNISNKLDNSAPFVTAAYGKSPDKSANKGEYTIYGVSAGDIFCPNVKVLLTVYDPEGNVVTSTDGVLLKDVDAMRDYKILLEDYGGYSVSVKATEADYWKFDNTAKYEYRVTVSDVTRPTITFKTDFTDKIKVGETLAIPEYTLSDDCSSADKLTVITIITNPKGLPNYLFGDERSLRCEYAGVYTVKMFVYDEAGNLTTFETKVTVG